MKSSHLSVAWIVLLLAVLATTGCDSSAGGGGSDMDALADQLSQSKQAAAAAAAAEQARVEAEKIAAEKAAAEEAAKQAALQAAHPAPAADNKVTITMTIDNPQALLSSPDAQAAMAGIVGKKQRKNQVEGPLRYYGAIANARVIAMDRMLGVQIRKSLDNYVHGENDGKYPKTTEEFMKNVVGPGMIELPELEPNQEYYFDPEQHELVILERIDEPAAEAAPIEN
jgi:hypothetical protein